MKSLPLRYRGKVVKVAYAYDDEVDRWYVCDHNILDTGLGLEADSQEELDADVVKGVGMLEDYDREFGDE